MANLESTELAWAQIEYQHQIPDLCHEKMKSKMQEINESSDSKTVSLYHMLHGDQREKPQSLPYARQIPCNFAAANNKAKSPAWYSLTVEGDPGQEFPDSNEMHTLGPDGEYEEHPDIRYMLEIRNGLVKRASIQDVENLKLLHDLVLKVEAIEKQNLEKQIRPASEILDDEKIEVGTSGTFTEKSIAGLRHVLFEFVHYDWEHKKIRFYCTTHLGEQWLSVEAKSGSHHAYKLIQKLEEVAGLRPQARLTIPVGSGRSLENEVFVTFNIVHPLPHLVESPRCKISYFVELWEVTDLATDYIKDWRPNPTDYSDIITFLDRLSDVWFQDLSLLYEKHSCLFQDPKKKVATQVASIKVIKAQVPTFCSLAVLPRWHGIPHLYAQLKHKWGVTDEEAEDLDGHLHVAYDEILTKLTGEDLELDN
ncbi:hypothetical protein M436DRAFT_82199 [Aureobasidium namibiae CBS 147.97]|uniref:Uncharacterized protein n=1 Tax=Aureobasidium namibiae CBS 147.97 TaxID=1043004 RepID=A0A074WT41_9PEZI|nr:uncharacterized protein M436DRAFT_82199 [Aureobasidium namibiae CBS 147.97]KEQ72927.1 hypothetical protein M436DRAFT_82199 [Aureobasidium namibiae CBS 147.97]